jgi:uncharacterized membrane protein YqjE
VSENDHSSETAELSDRPVAELLKQLSEQTATLVRQELELARVELTEKSKKAGLGAGMFGGAGVLGLYAVGALTACLILALSRAIEGWLAALVVAVAFAALAGVLALTGKSKVQQAVPPVPAQTLDSVKEDIAWTKQRAQAAKN